MSSQPTTRPATRPALLELITHVGRLVVFRGSPADLRISRTSLYGLLGVSILVAILVRVGLPNVTLARATVHALGEIGIALGIIGIALRVTNLSERFAQAVGSLLLVSLFADLAFLCIHPISNTTSGTILLSILFVVQITAFLQIVRRSLDRGWIASVLVLFAYVLLVANFFAVVERSMAIVPEAASSASELRADRGTGSPALSR